MEANEKRMAENYEIIQSIRLGEQEVVFGVDPASEEPYFCGFCQRQQIGIYVQERYEQCVVGDDYVKAVERFAAYVQEQCRRVREEQAKVTVPRVKITEEMCIAHDYSQNLNGRIIALKPSVLRPEYRSAEHQLVLVDGGFGASGSSRGTACFCANLYTGKREQWRRSDVMGIVKPEHLPDWAKERAAAIQREQAEKAKKRKSAAQER